MGVLLLPSTGRERKSRLYIHQFVVMVTVFGLVHSYPASDPSDWGIPAEPLNPDDFEAAIKYANDVRLGLITEPMADDGSEVITETLEKPFPNLWKHGRVPYEISTNVPTESRAVIMSAASKISAVTCIKFVSRISAGEVIKDDDFLFIKSHDTDCAGYVGRQGGKQVTTLTAGCFNIGTIMHELLHVIGFEHEHQRKDRDKYVTIHRDRIIESLQMQFDLIDVTANVKGSKYDYGSIMHYSEMSDCKAPCDGKTIEPKKKFNGTIGQRNDLSKLDIKKIMKIYKCKNVGPPANEQAPVSIAQTIMPPIFMPNRPKAAMDNCVNFDKRCALVKESDCGRNQTWVNFNCRKTCRNAPNGVNGEDGGCGGCRDYNPKCGEWAKENYCKIYPEYMLIYCAKQCGLCTSANSKFQRP